MLKQLIRTDNGHFQITFKNKYTISVFNGRGSYSNNHNEIDLGSESDSMEIAIFSENGWVTKEFFGDIGDDVVANISPNQFAHIVAVVSAVDSLKQ